jgi:hypothetical protein
MAVLGWLLVIAAAVSAYVFFRRSTAPLPQGAAAPPPNRAIALGSALFAVVLAFYLLSAAPPSVAELGQQEPTYVQDFSTAPARWVSNNRPKEWKADTLGIEWDPQEKRLLARMKVGEGWYGVVPVDWEGDVFRAEWDITILKRDEDPDNDGPGAVAGVGMFDNTISNIDDTDHVGGSSIMAVFGDTARLRVSDINLLAKSALDDTKLEVGKTYHAVLGYDRRARTATLQVTEKDGGAPVADLKLEELRDLSSNIDWFGISMKGFSRNKKKWARGGTKEGLFINAAIDNVRYYQP